MKEQKISLKLKAKDVNLSTGGPLIAIMNESDAAKLDLHAGDRIRIKRLRKKKEIITVVDISSKGIETGEVGLFEEVLKKLDIEEGTRVEIEYSGRPSSLTHIKEKMEGKTLNQEDILEIVKDIVDNRLSEVEMTYFISACYSNGLSLKESAFLTRAIVETSDRLKFNGKVVLDKHCISGDTPVIIKNSGQTKVKEASEIINKVFERSKDIKNYNGAEFSSSGLNNLKVLTFDDNGKVSYKVVSGVFRAKSPKKLYQITLKGNRNVKLTSDHTVFVLKKGQIVNLPTKELKSGDYVVVPNNIINNKKIKEINFKIKWKKRNYHNFPNKIAITPEFVRFLAYYIAEGFTNFQGVFLNFGSHEKELIADAKKCIKKVFGYQATINKPHKTATRVSFYNQYFAQALKECVDPGCNALEKRIPHFIFDISKELQLEFLKALFKCDGHVRRGYEATYVTSSKELFTQLQYLLSLLGLSVSTHKIKACTRKFPTGDYKVKESYQIYTQAREIYGGRIKANVSFINLLPVSEIGAINIKDLDYDSRKAIRSQKYVTKDKLKRYLSSVRSEDVRKLITKDISVLPIKSVKQVDSNSKYVYDFKVPGYNKFMAGSAPMCVHNCIGGVPNNRTTMIVVPILASLGYIVPKTSSRSITSPAGTADTMEVLAPVTLGLEKIKHVIKKANGCMVWGGAINLAAADDKMIRIRHPLSIDPKGMLLASILAKKKAVGATHVLIDIPYGYCAKIATKKEASKLGKSFTKLGKILGMKVKVVLTDGSEPIGHGIGPALEAKDVLLVLQNDGPNDLREKGIFLATEMLKMVNVKDAKNKVLEALNSGRAYEKFMEIIIEQGGRKHIKLPKARHLYDVFAPKSGTVTVINNKGISKVARIAGAPRDKVAGLYLRVKKGLKVEKGEELFTIHARSKAKLNSAVALLKEVETVKIE